ncbi:class I SAM-dependent methyltransferase [Neptuniibacter sp.]|uniref:class I SAM-dependent methyltransferase n=1 Tax=Neptuniibacter sp. TaxID=1962643 RepID=UPI003B58C166
MKVCLSCGYEFVSQGWSCPSCAYEPPELEDFKTHAVELAHGGGGFKSEYFSELSSLEATNFWFKARNEIILWALQKYKPDASSFLEVGCGTGYVLSGIINAKYDIALSGSEIFLEGLSYASQRVPSADFMQMDARSVPFVNEFDAIGAFDVLEHIEEDETVLSQLHGALNQDGILLLTVPQHPWLWSAADDYACHVRRYTGKGIEAIFRKAGFEIQRSTSFVTSLLPAMMLSRLLNKSVEDFDPVAELKINPVLNKIFLKMMMIELSGIKRGLNYPIGGSRLIVARKQ